MESKNITLDLEDKKRIVEITNFHVAHKRYKSHTNSCVTWAVYKDMGFWHRENSILVWKSKFYYEVMFQLIYLYVHFESVPTIKQVEFLSLNCLSEWAHLAYMQFILVIFWECWSCFF